MSHDCSSQACGGCSGGGCGSCCGGGELLLCQAELDILLALGQYAFLPIIQTSQDGELYFLPLPEERSHWPQNFSDVLLALERKHLIQIDPDLPLSNVSYGDAAASVQHRCGSLALTLQGQEALDWIDL